GPDGMTVGSDGVVRWQANALTSFFPDTDIEAVVEVSNPDHTVTIPIAVRVQGGSNQHPLVRSSIEMPTREQGTFLGDFDQDGVTEILLTDNKQLIYTLEPTGGSYRQDW